MVQSILNNKRQKKLIVPAPSLRIYIVNEITHTSELIKKYQQQLRQQVVISQQSLHYITVCLLCKGHLLIEDAPGLGKTTLAKALAKSWSLDFKRIQCTPDLLPSDITGVNIFDQHEQSFSFHPGPVFTNFLLADEINRTSPRTQSALLEAMAERTVTTDRETRPLPSTFMVIATQNPVEYSGTYPLPEAQLDRFFMKISLGYPNLKQEMDIIKLQNAIEEDTIKFDTFKQEDLITIQQAIHTIHCEDDLVEYAVSLVQATRQHEKIRLGSSPRGAIALLNAAKAHALIQGSEFVTAQMIQDMIKPILSHRIVTRSNSDNKTLLLNDILAKVNVPGMPKLKTETNSWQN